MVSIFDQSICYLQEVFAEKQIPELYNELRDTVYIYIVKPAIIGTNC